MVEDVQKLEAEGKIFVIRPQTPLEIGRMSHDPEEMERAYQRGCADGRACMESLRAWLALPAKG